PRQDPNSEAEISRRVKSVAEKLRAFGPLMAVRRGDWLALLPRSLEAGSKAAVIPLPTLVPSREVKEPRIVALTSELSKSLRGLLRRWDIGSAHALLWQGSMNLNLKDAQALAELKRAASELAPAVARAVPPEIARKVSPSKGAAIVEHLLH